MSRWGAAVAGGTLDAHVRRHKASCRSSGASGLVFHRFGVVEDTRMAAERAPDATCTNAAASGSYPAGTVPLLVDHDDDREIGIVHELVRRQAQRTPVNWLFAGIFPTRCEQPTSRVRFLSPAWESGAIRSIEDRRLGDLCPRR